VYSQCIVTKGAFQELDSISLLNLHTKICIRPTSAEALPSSIANAYRCAFYGRPGTGFVDLPADIINDPLTLDDDMESIYETSKIASPPKSGGDEVRLDQIMNLIKNAKAPLVIIGKGAAYAGAESSIRTLIDQTNIPFLPSPMGKGVVRDSHPANVSSARSAVLKMTDVVLILGARLNWIFHYGQAPKWNPKAKFIQVDISPEEMGRNAANAEYSLLGDVGVVVAQLLKRLGTWRYDANNSKYIENLQVAKQKNEKVAALAAKDPSIPLTYARAFDVIKTALHALSPPPKGGICYIAEGANTMDISRSIFPLEYPRLRLDAGTYATMGVGLPYAIAAWEAYNAPNHQASSGPAGRKKVVAIEGDSAFGFSGMEVETMARMGMDILIFVINNGGIYFGDSNTKEDWTAKQEKTQRNEPGLRSWALGWEVKYQKLAEACGGLGFFVRTPEELEKATIAGFNATVPVIVNVIIQSGGAEKAVSQIFDSTAPSMLMLRRASGGRLLPRKSHVKRTCDRCSRCSRGKFFVSKRHVIFNSSMLLMP
jgi:2-hydroxyacyl-CoA lyase 1